MTGEPEKTGTKQDGKFKPGVSGNPAGKPRGARNKVTALVDALIEGEAEELAKVAIERAKAGDGPLLKSLIERLSPPTQVWRRCGHDPRIFYKRRLRVRAPISLLSHT